LLYQAHVVPVGDDQRQHLEYTRDLAQRFNHIYGETFVLPEVMIPKAGARVMGLDNPLNKMSKSEGAESHAIYLLDPPSRVKKNVMRAVTDSLGTIGFSDEPERAGINNLLTIYQSLSQLTQKQAETQFADKGYGDLKKAVVEVVNTTLEPLQKRFSELMDETGYLDTVLAQGAEKARIMANRTLQQVKDKVGFLPTKLP
jgi:tryptophanyl-tRNA synthetase